jgi:hypothetical protein
VVSIILSPVSTGQSPASGSEGARIPPISGIVFDPLAGKPVSGIEVAIRTELGVASFGDGGRETLRQASSTTSAEGRFSFPPEVEPRAALPLAGISALTLSVDTQEESLNPGGEIMNGTLKNRSYFPIKVQLLGDCGGWWSGTCISLPPMGDLRVPLFPVVDDPARCKSIGNSQWSELCRQLNTYRAAFVHLDTFEQIRNDKQLCRSVDQGHASTDCLNRLRLEVRGRTKLTRASAGLVREPIENVVIRSIPGLVPGFSTARFDSFDEAIDYEIVYEQDDAPYDHPVTVTVSVGAREPAGEDIATLIELSQVLPFTGARSAVFEGRRVMLLGSTIAWSSKNNIVCIGFSGLGPAALPLEARRDLIRLYMQKYPDSR